MHTISWEPSRRSRASPAVDIQLVRAGVVALESRISLLPGPAVVASVSAVLPATVVIVEERPDGAALAVAAPRVAPAVGVAWRLRERQNGPIVVRRRVDTADEDMRLCTEQL